MKLAQSDSPDSLALQFLQNPLIFQRWCYLADKLEASPDLLGIALENIQRWTDADRLGDRWALRAWKSKIEAARDTDVGMDSLMELLRDDGERARQLKSCSPFPGVLSREERDRFTCAWTL
ncbi:MAG: hypothetical protein L3J39_11985 [Verrucomicrobiales bacterium]|nr:hypothetical protein [Verrucomicrobiales bacterium]